MSAGDRLRCQVRRFTTFKKICLKKKKVPLGKSASAALESDQYLLTAKGAAFHYQQCLCLGSLHIMCLADYWAVVVSIR